VSKRMLTHALARGLHLFLIALLVAGWDIAVGLGPPVRADPGVIYVKADATGGADGSSWEDAYTSLQLALGAAHSEDEIWVAQGTYKPTAGIGRTATFQLVGGVALFGGFAGGETARSQRDWEAHATILSGDIGTAGDNSDNSYHVVTGSGTYPTAVLDGFTVTSGNANGSSAAAQDRGGGMYNRGGSPTVGYCTFSGNFADYGGGMCNEWSSDPVVAKCTFNGNFAYQGGGGMYNEGYSDPTLANCTFSDNFAYSGGGGMYNRLHSDPTLANCTFSDNFAYSGGGGMYNEGDSDPILTNCTFSGNSAYSDAGGIHNEADSHPTLRNAIVANSSESSDCSGDGTITSQGHNLDSDGTCGLAAGGDLSNTDPLLGPLQDNGGPTLTHRLLAGSPAIDGGDPAGCTDPWGIPLTTDQRGAQRPADGDCDTVAVCDIGAYEAFDTDCDGVLDAVDNCPDDPNPSQEDEDGDGVGDACEPTVSLYFPVMRRSVR
jgi:parallel beta-helix repeat protein